ncbi:MAG: hypothetical protein AB8B55_08350 [Mariniblastus sp.]
MNRRKASNNVYCRLAHLFGFAGAVACFVSPAFAQQNDAGFSSRKSYQKSAVTELNPLESTRSDQKLVPQMARQTLQPIKTRQRLEPTQIATPQRSVSRSQQLQPIPVTQNGEISSRKPRARILVPNFDARTARVAKLNPIKPTTPKLNFQDPGQFRASDAASSNELAQPKNSIQRNDMIIQESQATKTLQRLPTNDRVAPLAVIPRVAADVRAEVVEATTAPQARIAKALPAPKPTVAAKLPQLNIAKPKLADPKLFLSASKKIKPNNGSRRRWTRLQDDINDETLADPTPSSSDQKSLADDARDDNMLLNLPKSNLHAPLPIDSMQRATYNREIADPNLTFAANAYTGTDYRQDSQPVTKTWQTPNMVHRPLYFEDVNLERYGNGRGAIQPILSGVHFFSSVAFLPYKTGATAPTECVYTMGYFRPGDCNPAHKNRFTPSRKGLLHQTFAAGVVFFGL